MNPAGFVSNAFGDVRREPGNAWAFWHFEPTRIPRDLDLTMATVIALSDADNALGRLQGLGHLLTDPALLLGPYIKREAVASSRIEGTETTLGEVLRYEASEDSGRNENVAEVERYVAATYQGSELIKTLPISRRLAEAVHHTLLQGVRGADKLPGEFRRSPVWVGSPSNSPDTAVFVPPLPTTLGDHFSDWERFVNDRDDGLPILLRCALMHYQFETIHPFLDGNGRIGRLLVALLLVDAGRLPTPLLYLSGYLEAHRREYYDRLQAVRQRGEIQEWLQFFLTAIKHAAGDAVLRAERLVALREHYLTEARASRSNLGALIDVLFANPFVTVRRVQSQLALSNPGARNIIRNAEGRGWLTEVGSFGRGGRVYWSADAVLAVVDAPLTY